MHQMREDIDILFRRTAPEMVLENIRTSGRPGRKKTLVSEVGIDCYSYLAYEHYAALNLPEYSPDEVEIRFEAVKEKLEENPGHMLFSVLYRYAESVLDLYEDEPICRLEEILNWNSISKRLGQDLFTTAWMAWRDTKTPFQCGEKTFAWPAVLKSDDKRLNILLEKGLAENHFHLNGSTQSFALSWACLMNHPDLVKRYFVQNSNFDENLNLNITRGTVDKVMKWADRILYAAMIRTLLFLRCIGIKDNAEILEEFMDFDRFPLATVVKRQTDVMRTLYGAHFQQKSGRKVCLDYANCERCYSVDEKSFNRLLAGERNFLYQCFRMQFEGKFIRQESALFYFYLLIKSNFRSELIQVNMRPGFQNFSWYQNRKNQFFGNLDEYWTESYRLSVCASVKESHLVALEARIMPKDTPGAMYREIKGIDDRIAFSADKSFLLPHYVIHFPKKKFSGRELPKYRCQLLPRNWDVRRAARCKAVALAEYLRFYDTEKTKIRGIDACSIEIGCRPETFATEFRYLRGFSKVPAKYYWHRENKHAHRELGIAYHVGEDFLDIADGLRAIDEALLFLNMKKGDRLGHAIALGIDAKAFYEQKRNSIYLTKQDYLDNLIWMLYRSLEWNISISANHRAYMQEEARRMLGEIYYSYNSLKEEIEKRQPAELLDMYYDSWKLRGDHPDLYKSGGYEGRSQGSLNPYERYMEREGIPMDLRINKVITSFYSLYHFDTDVKRRGLQAAHNRIECWYVDLVGEFQKALQKIAAQKGIAIECNPTSNVLISTFRLYDRHPILTLNHYYLEEDEENVNIQVSINTDDLGVFDTSLANEYALLLSAVCRARHRKGNFNDDAVYDYLDYLRTNGLNMAFSVIRDQKQEKKRKDIEQ